MTTPHTANDAPSRELKLTPRQRVELEKLNSRDPRILTAAEIDEIERRVDAASPGPWKYTYRDWPTDRDFVIHSRTDVPALIATVRHERERAEDAERLLEGLKRGSCWCDVGIGNPMMRDHSAACVAVSAFLAQRRKETAQS